VVIPTLNEQANIARTLTSAWRAGADEVLIADGGSTDSTREIAEPRVTRWLDAPRGRARQLNAAAAAATGDVLLFLHADNRLHPACIEQMHQALAERSEIEFGGFQQRIEADGLAFRLLERGNAYRVARWGWAYGDQALFVRRAFFDSQGGFPELGLMEDLVFSQRARCVSRPVLLPGPVIVSARRWRSSGILRQTLRNWWLIAAYKCGVSPDQLARHYRPHAAGSTTSPQANDSAKPSRHEN
jgi:rSAM/selenodomain-associated transferase 2